MDEINMVINKIDMNIEIQASRNESILTDAVKNLKSIEERILLEWESIKIYEVDASFQDKKSSYKQYLATFPYPYVNGSLYYKHSISLLKCDFAFRYNRLLGKEVPLPFNFPYTEMGIKECADKIKTEMEVYGYPPKFSEEIEVLNTNLNGVSLKDKSKETENQAIADSSSIKYQWQLMQTLGLQNKEIRKFADAAYWLEYFPLRMDNESVISKSEGSALTLAEIVKKFSIDGTRLCLADFDNLTKDDSITEIVAGIKILELYDFLKFVEFDIHDSIDKYRYDTSYNFHDKVFESEMNLKIRKTGENYSKMLYHEALKKGFYEFQKIRNKYLQMCEVPNYNIIKKYVEIQTILLSPICPHFCECIWRGKYVQNTVIKKDDSILNARWPEVGEINEILIKWSEYLVDTAHRFKILRINYEASKRINEMKNEKDIVITRKGIIWVANKTCSSWRCNVFRTLKKIYFKYGNKLPDDEVLCNVFGSKLELRRYMNRFNNKVMPFVRHIKGKLEAIGPDALYSTPDEFNEFDEFDLLANNIFYLKRIICLQEIDVKYVDEASEETKEECYPGAPCIDFFFIPGIRITIINPKSSTNLFQLYMLITKPVTALEIVSYIANKRDIKDPASIMLYRYNDPELGPRIRRIKGTILNGTTEIPLDSIFNANIETKNVEMNVADETYPIGPYLIYIDKSLEKSE